MVFSHFQWLVVYEASCEKNKPTIVRCWGSALPSGMSVSLNIYLAVLHHLLLLFIWVVGWSYKGFVFLYKLMLKNQTFSMDCRLYFSTKHPPHDHYILGKCAYGKTSGSVPIPHSMYVCIDLVPMNSPRCFLSFRCCTRLVCNLHVCVHTLNNSVPQLVFCVFLAVRGWESVLFSGIYHICLNFSWPVKCYNTIVLSGLWWCNSLFLSKGNHFILQINYSYVQLGKRI